MPSADASRTEAEPAPKKRRLEDDVNTKVVDPTTFRSDVRFETYGEKRYRKKIPLASAVADGDVDAVREYFTLNVPHEALVYYLEDSNVAEAASNPNEHAYVPELSLFVIAVKRCIKPEFLSADPSEMEKSYKIIEILLENGVSPYYTSYREKAARADSLEANIILSKSLKDAYMTCNNSCLLLLQNYPNCPGTFRVGKMLLEHESFDWKRVFEWESGSPKDVKTVFEELYVYHLGPTENVDLLMLFIDLSFDDLKNYIRSTKPGSCVPDYLPELGDEILDRGFANHDETPVVLPTKSILILKMYFNIRSTSYRGDFCRECPICYEQYDDCSMVDLDECGWNECSHYFCFNCMLDTIAAGHRTCPLCRVELPQEWLRKIPV